MVTVLLGVCLLPRTSAAQALSPADAQAWRDDLRFMAQAMERTHKNVHHDISRERFAAMVDALDAKIPTLARHEVIVEMAKIVAAVGDGHTNIYPTRDAVIGFHSLPVAFTFFSGDLFVRAAHESQRELAGAKVLRIGDRTVADAYAAVRQMIGCDNDHGAHYWGQFLLAMPEVLHAFRITTSVDDVPLTVEVGGRERSVVLHPFEPVAIMSGEIIRAFDARPGWVDARTADPLWLRHTDAPYWFEHVGTLLYVQINQILDGKNETLPQFAERVRAEIERTHPGKVAIDLRLNRGGNGDLNAAIVRALVQSTEIDQEGRLFAIIGPGTFSAAQMLCNALERYTRVTFVGEPTGSRGNAYGDSRKILLPNTGLTVRASLYYWQEWHPLDTRDATSPSIGAPMTIAAYAAGRDPALDAIQAFK